MCICAVVITVGRLGEVETEQVIRFRTVLPVTHHQLSSFSTTKTEVLVHVFALRPQLPLLRLQFGVPGFVLPLHHHNTLKEAKGQNSIKHGFLNQDCLLVLIGG